MKSSVSKDCRHFIASSIYIYTLHRFHFSFSTEKYWTVSHITPIYRWPFKNPCCSGMGFSVVVGPDGWEWVGLSPFVFAKMDLPLHIACFLGRRLLTFRWLSIVSLIPERIRTPTNSAFQLLTKVNLFYFLMFNS